MNTANLIPKHFLPLSNAEIDRAWKSVWRELDELGFGCRRLESCQVYIELFSTAYGYQWFGDREDDKHCGDIVLPRISLSHWGDYFVGRQVVSALDVLRHEYGHAYADVNRRRIETKKFERAFGWPHEVVYAEGFEYDPEYHVTEYAAVSTGEDFAEVFWLYLKHRGKLPARLYTSPVRRKWRFIEDLRKG
jgi:hypothetical protein